MVNNIDPDQTVLREAVWSGVILFISMIRSPLKCT